MNNVVNHVKVKVCENNTEAKILDMKIINNELVILSSQGVTKYDLFRELDSNLWNVHLVPEIKNNKTLKETKSKIELLKIPIFNRNMSEEIINQEFQNKYQAKEAFSDHY